MGKVIHRTINNSGSAPDPTDVALGEIILNTVDGFLFTVNPSGSLLLLNKNTTAVSSSYAITASYAKVSAPTPADWGSITNIPVGLVSSSAQVSYIGLINIPVGIVSSSTQVDFTGIVGKPVGLVSSSGQVSYAGLSGIPVGIVSSSGQISYNGLTNIPVGILSSSTQFNALANTSASYANTATTAPNYLPLTGGNLTGNLIISGNITVSASKGFVGDGSQLTGVISSSYATIASRSYAADSAITADFRNLNNKPTLVSASSQISYTGLTNIPVGIVSSSGQISYTGLTNIPVGLISASSQVSYAGLSGIPVGIISSSGQVAYTGLSGIPIGIVSSSGQVSYTGLSNIPVGIVSSSAQASTWTVASSSYASSVSSSVKDAYITLTIGNNTDIIQTGSGGTTTSAGYVFIPPGKIISATLVGTPQGTLACDIWGDTFPNFSPTIADRIGTASFSNTTGSQDTTLAGWITNNSSGMIADVRIASASLVTSALLVLQIRRG